MGCKGSKSLLSTHPGPLPLPLSPPTASGRAAISDLLATALRGNDLHNPAASLQNHFLCASADGDLSARIREACGDANPATVDEDNISAALLQAGKLVTADLNPAVRSLLPCPLVAALDTPVARYICGKIGPLAWRLTQSYFVGADSGHSGMVLGPKGCGKSEALKRFAVVAPVLLPSLRVVYIDAASIHDESHPAHLGLMKFLLSLNLRNSSARASNAGAAEEPAPVSTESTESFPGGLSRQLYQQLSREGIHLMIIVDNVQAMMPLQSTGEAARDLMDEVRLLAASQNGHTSVVCCSSSCRRGRWGMGRDDKVRLYLLSHDASPTSAAQLDPLFFKAEATEAHRRAVTFLLGNDVSSLLARRIMPPHWGARMFGFPDAPPARPLVQPPAESEALVTELCGALHAMWYGANEPLLLSVVANASSAVKTTTEEDGDAEGSDLLARLDLERIGAVDWGKRFRPIADGRELNAVLDRVAINAKCDASAVTTAVAMNDALSFLEVDAALVMRCYDPATGRTHWYPRSVLSVLLLRHHYGAQYVGPL